MHEPRPRLLIFPEDPGLRDRVAAALALLGETIVVPDTALALKRLEAAPVDLVVLGWPPSSLLSEVERKRAGAPLLGVAAACPPGERARALRAGLSDLSAVPEDTSELVLTAERLLAWRRLERDAGRLRDEQARRDDLPRLLGLSGAVQAARLAIREAAGGELPVLFIGESGTGRERAARALHAASPRRGGPFVALRASAYAASAIDEELFGREEGAAPGGRVEAARGGTLFVGEVTWLPLAAQARLLALLSSRPAGLPAGAPRPDEPRVAASCGAEIGPAVSSGRFLAELQARLGSIVVRLPPLRERPEDIPPLAAAFLDALCREARLPRRTLSPDALEALVAHPWKGNVRELRHVVECLVLQSDGEMVTRRDLPRALQMLPSAAALPPVWLPDSGVRFDRQVAGYERALLAKALERTAGQKKEAATLLGLNKDQMKYLCRKHGL